jgi:hypothetical protein
MSKKKIDRKKESWKRRRAENEDRRHLEEEGQMSKMKMEESYCRREEGQMSKMKIVPAAVV